MSSKNLLLILLILVCGSVFAASSPDYNTDPIITISGGTSSSNDFQNQTLNIGFGEIIKSNDYQTVIGPGSIFQDFGGSVTIDSPADGTKYTTDAATTDVVIQYSYNGISSHLKKYWVKADSGEWIANGTSTQYTFTLGNGSHTLYVKAQQQNDVNTAAASVTINVEVNKGSSGEEGSSGGGSSGGTTPTESSTEEEAEEECASDSDCGENEKCVEHACIPLECKEGFIPFNHSCVECITHTDCKTGYNCIDNICVPQQEKPEEEKPEEKPQGGTGGTGGGGGGGISGKIIESCVNHLTPSGKPCNFEASFSTKNPWLHSTMKIYSPNDVKITIQDNCIGFPKDGVFSCTLISKGNKKVIFTNSEGKEIYTEEIRVREFIVEMPKKTVPGEEVTVIIKEDSGKDVKAFVKVIKDNNILVKKSIEGSFTFITPDIGVYDVKFSLEDDYIVQKKIFSSILHSSLGGAIIEEFAEFFLGENFYRAPFIGIIELILCTINAIAAFFASKELFKPKELASSREQRLKQLKRTSIAVIAFILPTLVFRFTIAGGLVVAIGISIVIFAQKQLLKPKISWKKI